MRMKILNYLNLNQHPVQCSFRVDRTRQFSEIYHAHQGMELLFVHEGSIRVVVNRQIVDLTAGNLVVFRPFQLHRVIIRTEPGVAYIRTLLVFEPGELVERLEAFPSLRQFLLRLWKEPLQQQVFQSLPLARTVDKLEEYRQRMETAEQGELLEEQMLCLADLLGHLKRHEEPELLHRLPPAQGSAVAEQVMDWLEAHYAEPFQLEQLAQAVHLTPSHVSAAFRQAVGSTITDYLTAVRVRQACLLLRTGDKSVEEIGQAVGLQNTSYFCQMFRKHVGLSPHRFRRSFQRTE